jgi:transposase, IS5 family
VHFRKRLKEEGLEFLLSQSVALHPKAKNEKEVQIDTTVQEKNITFPTDAKLAKKVISFAPFGFRPRVIIVQRLLKRKV